MQYRQGDVFITEVDELPSQLRRVERENGRVILAHGEVTGHAHAILDREAELFDHQDLEHRFLQVLADGGVELVHEEHDTIHLPAGVYEVRRQREYSPEAIRNVAD